MPLNAIVLEFDPILRIGEAELRLETVGLAIVLILSLAIAALIARATPAGDEAFAGSRGSYLKPDDLLIITMAALPGATIGGRLGYVLLHLDYFGANPAHIVDPAYGSLELTLGVVGGVMSAAYVLHLLRAPIGRWAHVTSFPLLLALGTGKLVQVLGGDGQGLPSDATWATLYSGDGPWGSLGPEIASHPSQVYEGIATLLLLQVLTILVTRGRFRVPDGSALLVALGLWALVRALVATTWRDAMVMGPLKAEQLIALAVAAGFAGFLLRQQRARQRAAAGMVMPIGGAAGGVAQAADGVASGLPAGGAEPGRGEPLPRLGADATEVRPGGGP